MNEDSRKLIASGALVLIFLLLVFAIFGEKQDNNQVVRPNPNGPAPPVIPMLPDLVADFQVAKVKCEAAATNGRDLLGNGRRRDAKKLAEGRKLYVDAKAEIDGCISFLQSGLVRRFNEHDPYVIQSRVQSASQKVNALLNWAAEFDTPRATGAPSLDNAADLLLQWLEGIDKLNNEAIQQLRADLERCRLRDWDDL